MNGVRYEYITQSNQHLINNVLDDVFDYPIKSKSLKSFLNQKIIIFFVRSMIKIS